MGEWIPCSDRMPEVRVEVLVWDGTGIYQATLRYHGGWASAYGPLQPTHWQPLPEPPKEGE